MNSKFITAMVVTNQAFGSSLVSLTPGIKGSFDIAVLEQAKDIYFDKVV
jgi:hypothetical protein